MVIRIPLLATMLPLIIATTVMAAEPLPAFKVTVQDHLNVCLLVPPTTTTAQLRALVYALREARQAGKLREFGIPPTSGGPIGPYGALNIYIFSDPRWASPRGFKTFMQSDTGSPSFYAVRATYTFGKRPGRQDFEMGTIGFSDVDRTPKRVFTKPYEKLFGGNY